MGNKIGIFTAVCEKDMHWFSQFTRQAEILEYPVAWFADKLSSESLEKLRSWKGTHFIHDNQNEQFSERSKEKAFNGLKGFDWAIQMDIDETWQEGAKQLIEVALDNNPDRHIANCKMVTVVREGDNFFQRTDKYFVGAGREASRERIYNLKFTWHWCDPITCGAYLFIDGKQQTEYVPFECEAMSVHWGYSTFDLCDEHRNKWEDVWQKTIGRIPYKTYDMLTDRETLIEKIPLNKKFYAHL